MKDHRKFYNFLRFMAVVSIAVGGILVIWLTASGALVPSKADNLPSSFWVSPAHRIMTGVMVLVSSLSGIAFGVCNFMCRLKAVGILAIVKAVCILGFIFVYWGSHIAYNLTSPLLWVAFAVSAGYCICGIYALKCQREEKNFNKSITAQ